MTNKTKKEAKNKKLKSFTVINDYDPNDSFEIKAKDDYEAHYLALKELGWWVAKN